MTPRGTVRGGCYDRNLGVLSRAKLTKEYHIYLKRQTLLFGPVRVIDLVKKSCSIGTRTGEKLSKH